MSESVILDVDLEFVELVKHVRNNYLGSFTFENSILANWDKMMELVRFSRTQSLTTSFVEAALELDLTNEQIGNLIDNAGDNIDSNLKKAIVDKIEDNPVNLVNFLIRYLDKPNYGLQLTRRIFPQGQMPKAILDEILGRVNNVPDTLTIAYARLLEAYSVVLVSALATEDLSVEEILEIVESGNNDFLDLAQRASQVGLVCKLSTLNPSALQMCRAIAAVNPALDIHSFDLVHFINKLDFDFQELKDAIAALSDEQRDVLFDISSSPFHLSADVTKDELTSLVIGLLSANKEAKTADRVDPLVAYFGAGSALEVAIMRVHNMVDSFKSLEQNGVDVSVGGLKVSLSDLGIASASV